MLENLKEKFNSLNIFKAKSKSFLGIDIGGSAIKVVQLKKEKGMAVLETYGELSLGPVGGTEVGRSTSLSDKQICTSLVTLMEESRVNIFRSGISIPVRSSLIFEMEVPNMPKEQLKKIVPIEARRYIPVPISEVVLDWRVISENNFEEDSGEEENEDERPAFKKTEDQKQKSNKKIKIFVVAIHKNALDKYKNIAKCSQLSLDFLEIEIFSTIRAVVDHNISTVVLLDIGSSVSKLYIVEYGIVKDSHIINRGSQDITLAISRTLGISIKEAEEKKRTINLENLGSDNDKSIETVMATNLKFILSGVSGVIQEYQKKNNKNIKELIFTGGGSVIKGLPEFSSNILKINSKIADPFYKINNPAFLDDVLKEIGPEFAVAVGVALRGLEDKK